MDYILTKSFLVESAIGGILLYKFPYSTLIMSGLVVGLYIYLEKMKKSSENVNSTYMNSVIYNTSGTFSLVKLPVPKFSSDEVLIKVKAASINPVDYKIRTCDIPFYRWFVQPTVGRDFSGIIIDKGINVSNFKIGDEVFGNAKGGSLSEFTVTKPNQIGLKPINLSFSETASLGLAAGTSLQALKFWGDLAGKKVLIIGASGGTGNFGVQIAKYYDAKVYAVCSSKNVEFVKSLGADVIIDYTKPNFQEEIQNEQFDLIYDTVTSPEDSNQEVIYRKYLKQEGKYVAINANGLDWLKAFI
jgi:NADPH:quinone reductase-like Zn-dependent oxidoreductase